MWRRAQQTALRREPPCGTLASCAPLSPGAVCRSTGPSSSGRGPNRLRDEDADLVAGAQAHRAVREHRGRAGRAVIDLMHESVT